MSILDASQTTNQLIIGPEINGDRWVSIHDMHIYHIFCRDNSVVFWFKEGFDLVENGLAHKTNNGYIELRGCEPSDLECMIFRRKQTKKGERVYGKPVSIEKLNKMLLKKNQCIEVFFELYDADTVYWRGELYPYPKNRIRPEP